jgi:hypothetical protein
MSWVVNRQNKPLADQLIKYVMNLFKLDSSKSLNATSVDIVDLSTLKEQVKLLEKKDLDKTRLVITLKRSYLADEPVDTIKQERLVFNPIVEMDFITFPESIKGTLAVHEAYNYSDEESFTMEINHQHHTVSVAEPRTHCELKFKFRLQLISEHLEVLLAKVQFNHLDKNEKHLVIEAFFNYIQTEHLQLDAMKLNAHDTQNVLNHILEREDLDDIYNEALDKLDAIS